MRRSPAVEAADLDRAISATLVDNATARVTWMLPLMLNLKGYTAATEKISDLPGRLPTQ